MRGEGGEHLWLAVDGPFEELEGAVHLFYESAAGLDPVAIVEVDNAAHLAHRRMVDVAADDPIKAFFDCLTSDGVFKVGDKFDCLFDALFEKSGQRPVRQADLAAHVVEPAVKDDGHVVGPTAEHSQPFVIAHYTIKLISMDDEDAAAIGGGVNGAFKDLDLADDEARIISRKLIVVAGHKDYAGAFAGLTQQLLQHVIVRLRPKPPLSQPPTIDDVTDQIEIFTLGALKKIEQQIGLAAGGAEVHV